jgi:hypothetical protein
LRALRGGGIATAQTAAGVMAYVAGGCGGCAGQPGQLHLSRGLYAQRRGVGCGVDDHAAARGGREADVRCPGRTGKQGENGGGGKGHRTGRSVGHWPTDKKRGRHLKDGSCRPSLRQGRGTWRRYQGCPGVRGDLA